MSATLQRGESAAGDQEHQPHGPDLSSKISSSPLKLFILSPSPDDPDYIPSLEKDECGIIYGQPGKFIMGGEDTRLGEFPFLGLLGKKSEDGIFLFCGATILNKW